LAAREVKRIGEGIVVVLTQMNRQTPALPQPTPTLASASFWSRWFGKRSATTVPDAAATRDEHANAVEVEPATDRVQQLVDSILTGYAMSLKRIDHSLEQVGLEPLPCVGEAFDPERMEVVAAVADSGCRDGEVVEEVRRGYFWKGRVFRFAQVSVARGRAT